MQKLWYKMKSNTWWSKADWGIDLKWEYRWIPVYVQCKKYIKNSDYKWIVRLSDIRNFYWWVVDELKWDIKNNKAFLVFITTWSFTKDAKSFAKRNNIKLLDYKDIARVSQEYSLEEFYSEIWNVNNIINKKFNSQTHIINFTFDDLLEEDIFEYLKNIRSYIVTDLMNLSENVTGFETFDDNILKEFARKRIHNLKWLKTFYKKCHNDLVREHIDNFSVELISWFKILSN